MDLRKRVHATVRPLTLSPQTGRGDQKKHLSPRERAAAQRPGEGVGTFLLPLGKIALFLFLVSFPVSGAGAEDPSADKLVLRRCPVGYARTSSVGAPTHGLLRDCLVEPGDRVEEGQVLGRLRDDEVRAEVQLRELEAKSDVDVRLNLAKKAQADNKMARSMALLRRGAINAEEVETHRLEVEAGALDVERARHAHQLAQVRLADAKTKLRACEFVSPHAGIIAAAPKHPGEPVAPNEILFKIVDPERIEVTGFADVTDVWRLHAGQPVRIILDVPAADLAVEHEVFEGRLTFIDTQVDPLTRTCKVLARVQNRDGLLRAGLEARMEIGPLPPPDAKPQALPVVKDARVGMTQP
ncbi:MAG: efflux RND transporter periplasmic adaptor subunit [Isosphaeraceae bacterium]|nr:efflux RND transporter periplasmic adaptor subunit [Isosphaeraceae bacterium]